MLNNFYFDNMNEDLKKALRVVTSLARTGANETYVNNRVFETNMAAIKLVEEFVEKRS